MNCGISRESSRTTPVKHLMSKWISTGAAMEDQSPHILKRSSRLCPIDFHHGPSSGIRVDECWTMKVRGHLYGGIVILLDTPNVCSSSYVPEPHDLCIQGRQVIYNEYSQSVRKCSILEQPSDDCSGALGRPIEAVVGCR
jgi:hypothetical protein